MKADGETVRHRIGNPLFAIETNLVSLERRVDNNPEIKQLVESMRASVERIKEVLEDLD
jgi:signal transduction histidine kinase